MVGVSTQTTGDNRLRHRYHPSRVVKVDLCPPDRSPVRPDTPAPVSGHRVDNIVDPQGRQVSRDGESGVPAVNGDDMAP